MKYKIARVQFMAIYLISCAVNSQVTTKTLPSCWNALRKTPLFEPLNHSLANGDLGSALNLLFLLLSMTASPL